MEDTDVKKLEDSEISKKLEGLDGWKKDTDKFSEYDVITKTFEFQDFKEAMAFVNKVGDAAEAYGHHPDIHLIQWNKVAIIIYTHYISGLSEWDFELAEKIEKLDLEK